MIYIIVPTFNRIEICKHFIEDLKKQSNQNYLLVLVDHGKNKVDLPSNTERTVYLPSDVNGWARAVNVGLRYTLDRANEGDSVLIINDDVILDSNYLQSIYDAVKLKPNAVLGTCCIDQNTNKTLRVAIRLNRWKGQHEYLYQYIDASKLPEGFIKSDVLTGKGTVIPVSVLKKIGIYNEEKLPHYKADHELIWRAKKNGFNVYACTKMQLRTLSDQKTANGKEPFWKTVKFLWFDMRSVMRLKDWWNYAFLAYSVPYALYFFIINTLKNTAGMIYLWFKTK